MLLIDQIQVTCRTGIIHSVSDKIPSIMALPSPLALALSVCLALLAVVCQGQAPGQWRAAVYEHIITEPAMVGCTQRVCNR